MINGYCCFMLDANKSPLNEGLQLLLLILYHSDHFLCFLQMQKTDFFNLSKLICHFVMLSARFTVLVLFSNSADNINMTYRATVIIQTFFQPSFYIEIKTNASMTLNKKSKVLKFCPFT